MIEPKEGDRIRIVATEWWPEQETTVVGVDYAPLDDLGSGPLYVACWVKWRDGHPRPEYVHLGLDVCEVIRMVATADETTEVEG